MKRLKIPYWYLLVLPWSSFGVGFALNATVIAANGAQMSILYPGGCGPATNVGDIMHSCMTHATRLKFLADWIVIPSLGVASIGDFLMWAGEYTWVSALLIWIAFIIKDHSRER